MNGNGQPTYLRLEPGKTYTVALKYLSYARTKGFNGPSLRWVLTDGRGLYTAPEFADRIRELGIQPLQKFEIERRKNGSLRVSHVADHCGQPSQAALMIEAHPELSEPSESIRGSHETIRVVGETKAGREETELAGALMAAVRISADAEEHARRKGMNISFDPSDIRAIGVALYQMRKQRAS